MPPPPASSGILTRVDPGGLNGRRQPDGSGYNLNMLNVFQPSIRHGLLRCVCLLLSLSTVTQARAQSEPRMTRVEVDAIIEGLRDNLLSIQIDGDKLQQYERFKDQLSENAGRWDYHGDTSLPGDTEQSRLIANPQSNRDHNGATALATFALLSTGDNSQSPHMKYAIRSLRSSEMYGLYALALRAHVWANLPQDTYGPLLQKDASRLLKSTGERGRFNYYVHPHPALAGTEWTEWNHHSKEISTRRMNYFRTDPELRLKKVVSRIDNSTTQYGLLALWEADKRGIKVPDSLWQAAAANFVELQQPDGGWKYSTGEDETSRTSMTAAGLTVLFIAQQQLYRDRDTQPEGLVRAIQRGMTWMDRNALTHQGPGSAAPGGGHRGYAIYGIERVGLASGVRYIGGVDWYDHFAKQLRGRSVGSASQATTLSFYLMLFSRGNVPIWANKLEIPKYAWNNRPFDIFYLNQSLIERTQTEMGWQSVPITSPVEDWLNAPLLYLSGRDTLELDAAQKAKIKQYVDLGGTLMINVEKRSRTMQNSAEKLAQELWPALDGLKKAPNDHPGYTMLEDVNPRRASFRTLHNGARDLMIVPDQDWGMDYQAETNPGRSESWKATMNLFALMTERGNLRWRYETPFTGTAFRPAGASIRVGLATPGMSVPIEPRAYDAMSRHLTEQVDKQVQAEPVDLGALIAASPYALVHIQGIDDTELSPEQVQAIKTYVEAGGTVLVEAIGGRNASVDAMENALTQALDSRARRMIRSVLTTGRGVRGGDRIDRLGFRPYWLILRKRQRDVNTTAIEIGRRPAVIFSRQDLTLGMMGLRHWGIDGYDQKSSRSIMHNLLLQAEKSKGNQ